MLFAFFPKATKEIKRVVLCQEREKKSSTAVKTKDLACLFVYNLAAAGLSQNLRMSELLISIENYCAVHWISSVVLAFDRFCKHNWQMRYDPGFCAEDERGGRRGSKLWNLSQRNFRRVSHSGFDVLKMAMTRAQQSFSIIAAPCCIH